LILLTTFVTHFSKKEVKQIANSLPILCSLRWNICVSNVLNLQYNNCNLHCSHWLSPTTLLTS
jgi:hypothetical protein